MSRPPRGYFGIGVWHPKTEVNIGTLWRSADLYGASFIFTVGQRYLPKHRQASDTSKAWRNIPLLHYLTIDELVDRLPHGAPLVAVELSPRAISLPDFTHPEAAVYLLGAEDHGITPGVLNRCHKIVQIPTVKDSCLNVATAGSIVLYDRFVKRMQT